MMELSAQRIKEIVAMYPGDISIFRIDGRSLKTLYFAPSIPTICGMTEEEYRARLNGNPINMIFENDLGFTDRQLTRFLAHPTEDLDCTYRLIHKTQIFTWVHARFRIIGTLEGSPVVVVVLIPISNEISRNMQVLDRTMANIYVVDLESHEMLYMNETARKAWGGVNYSGRRCFERYGLHSPCQWCLIPEMKNGSAFRDHAYVAVTDQWFRATMQEISWFGRKAAAVYSVNVTDLVRKQQELEASRASINSVVQNIPIGVIVCEIRDGMLLNYAANVHFRELIDLDPDESVPDYLELLRKVHPEERKLVAEAVDRCISKQAGARIDFRRRIRGDSAYRWLRMDLSAMRSRDSVMAYFCVSDITAEKEIDRERAKLQRLYESAVGEAEMIVWEYDIRTHRITMADNEATATDFLKFGLPQVIEKAPDDLLYLIAPDSVEDFLEMYREVDAGAPSASCEVWYKDQPGQEPRCERVIYNTIFDPDGKPVLAVGTGRNVTDARKTEIRYRRELSYLQQVIGSNLITKGRINLTRDRILEYQALSDKAGPVKAGDSYESAYHYFIENSSVPEGEPPLTESISRERMLNDFKEGKTHITVSYCRHRKGKTPVWMSTQINIYQVPVTGDIESFAYTYDVSEQILSEEVMKLIADSAFDYIGLIYVETGQFEFLKKSAGIAFPGLRELTDYEEYRDYVRSRFVDADELEQFDQASGLANIVEGLRRNGGHSSSYHRTENGRILCKQMNYIWMDRAAGVILTVRSDVSAAYLHDQEQIERIQKAKLEADLANQAKSSFLSGMSHDLRTPLNGVIGFTDIALREENPEKRRDYLKKIQASGRLLLDLVNDTLELSRIESSKLVLEPELANSREILETVITALKPSAELKNICLNADTARFPAATVWVDRLKVQKIILNLVSNAIKYTPAGGTVTITASVLEPPVSGCNRRFTVEDTGIGMSEEFLKKLYEPFAQEKRPEAANVVGTGLGLAIVKRTAEVMHGTIGVQSKQGIGTKFTVDLPFPPAETQKADQAEQKTTQTTLAGRKVLLCEDNYLNAEIAHILLEEAGMAVDTAVNGAEGLKLFEESMNGYYDIILMDVRMPVMDGRAATAAIRKLRRPDAARVPIVAMTADAFEEDARLTMEAGMNAYVTKPIDPAKLMETLKEVVAAEGKTVEEIPDT